MRVPSWLKASACAVALATFCASVEAQISNPQPNGLPFSNPWRFNGATGTGIYGFGTGTHMAIVTPSSGPASLPIISACGTSPTLQASADTLGRFTTGTGTVNGCTITFGQAYPNTVPRCFLQQQTGTGVIEEAQPTQAALVITFAASAPSTQWIWFCVSPSAFD